MGKVAPLQWLAMLALLCSCFGARGADINDPTLHWQGRQIRANFSDQFAPEEQRALFNGWIAFIARSLGQVYGRWPREVQAITVTPISAGGHDPIPWAEVHRGPIDRVDFFIASSASADALRHAWTGYHELAHLLIPYRGWGDAWFSEGLATYYQNLMQARAGVLSEQAMWQKLYEGFQRGRNDRGFDGKTLSQVSDRLRQDGGFMRVYWSGAWYFLSADLSLRRQSGGTLTLDRALEKLNACCADASLSVPEMVAKLDHLNEVALFEPLYEQVAVSTRQPAFESLFESLGMTIAGGRVNLQTEGAESDLRRQIVSGRPG